MLGLLSDLALPTLLAAAVIVLFAGFVKGAVGFAMPMIMVSGLGSILPPDIALAALIVPTLVTNIRQASRGGWPAAGQAVKDYRVFLIALLILLVCSAQLVGVISSKVLFLVIGVPLVVFAILQLVGWTLRLNPANRTRDEVLIGGFAGFLGGMSGIWGPPTVMYLTATDAPKAAAMRVQGVIYGIGSVALLLAHLRSGVLNAQTIPLSLAAMAPALIGMWMGYKLHDRMPQATFRRAMLFVLVVAGLNLIRRGLVA
ncbi:MAG: sulfite exporter TauE/SafE family protein [Pseudomonadota bacterium]|nr:sulfite exporter TauE/SafE family protein [Pseudomonadota bacterium]